MPGTIWRCRVTPKAPLSLLLLTLVWVAVGCPPRSADVTDRSTPGGAAVAQLDPDEFAEVVTASGVLVVNVHVPYEGEIPGTDTFVDYREVVGSDDLPDDLDSPIAVYCMTGSMSARAAKALADAGHQDVRELAGGMQAWQDSGRNLRFRS